MSDTNMKNFIIKDSLFINKENEQEFSIEFLLEGHHYQLVCDGEPYDNLISVIDVDKNKAVDFYQIFKVYDSNYNNSICYLALDNGTIEIKSYSDYDTGEYSIKLSNEKYISKNERLFCSELKNGDKVIENRIYTEKSLIVDNDILNFNFTMYSGESKDGRWLDQKFEISFPFDDCYKSLTLLELFDVAISFHNQMQEADQKVEQNEWELTKNKIKVIDSFISNCISDLSEYIKTYLRYHSIFYKATYGYKEIKLSNEKYLKDLENNLICIMLKQVGDFLNANSVEIAYVECDYTYDGNKKVFLVKVGYFLDGKPYYALSYLDIYPFGISIPKNYVDEDIEQIGKFNNRKYLKMHRTRGGNFSWVSKNTQYSEFIPHELFDILRRLPLCHEFVIYLEADDDLSSIIKSYCKNFYEKYYDCVPETLKKLLE